MYMHVLCYPLSVSYYQIGQSDYRKPLIFDMKSRIYMISDYNLLTKKMTVKLLLSCVYIP